MPNDAVLVAGVDRPRLDRIVFDVDVADTADGKALIAAIHRKLYPVTSDRYEVPNRKDDIAAAENAIVDIVRSDCLSWSNWPGARSLATAAYDAIYAEAEKRS